MATESTISSAAISFSNYTTDAQASVVTSTFPNSSATSTDSFTQQALYPRKNLISGQRSLGWRSADTGSRQHFGIAFDLGSAKTPGVFALINSNLSATLGAAAVSAGETNLSVAPNSLALTAQQVLLQGSATSNFAATQDFTYTLYAEDENNKIQKFYVGNDNSGAAASAYRYWRVVAHKEAIIKTYAEVGNIWLGEVTAIAPEIGSLKSTLNDASVSSASRSGAVYSDRIKPLRAISFAMKHTDDLTEAIPLQKLAASAGSTREVLLDISAWSTDSLDATKTRKGSDVYYGRLKSGFNWSAKFQRRRSVSFSFMETA